MAYSMAAIQSCPENPGYFCLPPEKAQNFAVQKEDFYRIPSIIASLFSKELTHYDLSLDTRWESPFFGAGVNKIKARLSLMVLGGTARIKGMNQESYAALICHELGHILGGPPYQDFKGAKWSSLEGQADYFAASICLPRYFSFLGIDPSRIDKEVESAGWHMFKSMMPYSTSTRDQALQRKKVKLPAVKRTEQSYPDLQCRYETFRDPSKRPSCWFSYNANNKAKASN